MKKIALKIVALMSLALAVIPAVADNTITYNATYDFGNLSLGTDTLGGVTYTTVSYDDLYNGGAPGKPSLPIDYIRFSVPWNAVNFTVSATLKNNLISTINYPVYPCQQPRLMNDTTPVVITLPDSSAYYANTYYPAQNAWVVGEGYLAGENHLVTVAVMPVSYLYRKTGNVDTHRLRKTQTVQLTLSYELKDSIAMYPIIRRGSTLRQEGFALTRSMVVNPNNVATFAPMDLMVDSLLIPGSGGRGGGVTPPDNPTDSTNMSTDQPFDPNPYELHNYPYLIITTDSLLNSVRRIAALKRQKGYEVKVISLTNVLNHPHACEGDIVKKNDTTYVVTNDDAGKVRQYLKYCFKYYGTKYVFLVGSNIPYRTIDIYHPSSQYIPNLPTDLYYSDLNGDWSTPIKISNIDMYFDIYVGRLLAKGEQQINNYAEKLYRYELNPGNGDYDYLNRIFYYEGLDMQDDNEVNYINGKYKFLFSDSTHIKESLNNKFPSGSDIINVLNTRKMGYLSILNHAGPSGFMTYGFRHHYENDTINYYLWAIDSIHLIYNDYIYNKDNHINNGLNNLSNKWYPNICYSIGCTTMPYNTVQGYENVNINIGESFTTGKDYGGPAFLGNTREGASEQGSTYLERLFAGLLSVDENTKIGKAEAMSKTLNTRSLFYVTMVHNLLGDPEFEIWTDEPHQYSNISISRGNDSISISGIDTVSTIVAYYGNDGSAIQQISTSSPVVLQNVSPNGSIMLYKHNYIPYIAPLLLQKVTLDKSQYVIASDVVAGYSIDSKRTYGDVIVKDGVEYEIEAKGTVTLQDGFKVEKGATFAVYPSSF